jgi:hypothetical protein
MCGPIPGSISSLLSGDVHEIQPQNSVVNHISIYVSMTRRGWTYLVCFKPFKVNFDLGFFTFQDMCGRLRHIFHVALCAKLHRR